MRPASPTLAIDTAHHTTGLMLVSGETSAHQVFPAKQTTELFLPTLQELLKTCAMKLPDLRHIVWNAGPGSFTGLRLASALIQGLTFSRRINVVALHTFAALLKQVEASATLTSPTSILAAHDARADEVYWALYRWQGQGYRSAEIQVSAPERVLEILQGEKVDMGVGDGFAAFSALMAALRPGAEVIEPSAALMPALLGNMVDIVADPQYAHFCLPRDTAQLPHYVRERVAKPLVEQQAWHDRFRTRGA